MEPFDAIDLEGIFYGNDDNPLRKGWFDPRTETLTQDTSLIWKDWLPSNPIFLEYCYYVGLNSCTDGELGRAFSINGIIVDSPDYRVSCSGFLFIKLQSSYSNSDPFIMYTSTDGVNWTEHEMNIDLSTYPFPYGNMFITRIIYVSKYKAFFFYSYGYIFKSYDGITWTVLFKGGFTNVFNMCWLPNENKFLIYGSEGVYNIRLTS
jgi:hypothetical protein